MRASRIPSARKMAVIALVAISAATAVMVHRPAANAGHGDSSAWSEAAWKMPLDNWGQGRVWHTTVADGTDLALYARTKSGFCNCYGGVANDDEIDRIGDVDLHGDAFAPVASGTVTTIGNLAGRKRLFQTAGHWTSGRFVLSIVAASDCKAVVATIVSGKPIPPDAEAKAVALLTGDDFRRWAANQQ